MSERRPDVLRHTRKQIVRVLPKRSFIGELGIAQETHHADL